MSQQSPRGWESTDPGVDFMVEYLTTGIVIEIEIVEMPVPPDAMIHSMYWIGRIVGLMSRGACLMELAAFLHMSVIDVAMAIDRHNSTKGGEVTE